MCVQDSGDTALMKASEYGYKGCVRLLIASGAIVNDTDVSLERPHPSTPWVSFHVVISFVSSLLSSERRMDSSDAGLI